MIRHMMDNALQKAMAEMNEGETLAICTPTKTVVFECKKVEAREPKIEGAKGEIFYDEFDLIPDPVFFGLARKKIEPLRAQLAKIGDLPKEADDHRGRGPQPLRAFPLPK